MRAPRSASSSFGGPSTYETSLSIYTSAVVTAASLTDLFHGRQEPGPVVSQNSQRHTGLIADLRQSLFGSRMTPEALGSRLSASTSVIVLVNMLPFPQLCEGSELQEGEKLQLTVHIFAGMMPMSDRCTVRWWPGGSIGGGRPMGG